MEENMVGNAVDEDAISASVNENSEIITEPIEDTVSDDSSIPPIPNDGEGVEMNASEAMGAIGSILGGLAQNQKDVEKSSSEMSKVFDVQKQIFENLDEDIDNLYSSINNLDAKIDVICDHIDANDTNINRSLDSTRGLFLISFGLNIISILYCIILTIVK